MARPGPGHHYSPWYYGQRAASLKFFAGLGNVRSSPGITTPTTTQVTNWLAAANYPSGISGVMYTTCRTTIPPWSNSTAYRRPFPSRVWFKPRLEAAATGGQLQLTLLGERGRHYALNNPPTLPPGLP